MRRLTAIFLCGFLSVGLCGPWNVFAQDRKEEEKELRTQIILNNLVNGLYLTDDQRRLIIKEAQALEKLKSGLEREADRQAAERREDLLLLKEATSEEDALVSEDLAQRIHKSSFSVQKKRKRYVEARERSTARVRAVLDETQLYLIENFKPCLVPPKGPARIGQAAPSHGLVKMLERLRSLKGRRYASGKEAVQERLTERLSLKGIHLKEEEKQAAVQKLSGVLERAAALSDEDFLIQKEALAEEVKNIVDKKKPLSADDIIARFLLDRRIIPLLKERG